MNSPANWDLGRRQPGQVRKAGCRGGTWDTTGVWSLACASDMQPKVYDSGSSMSLLPEVRKTVPFGRWGPVSQVPEEC